MTKIEMLAKMRELGACEGATVWVEAHPADTAREILLDCQRVDWLIWFVGRCAPGEIAGFVGRCAGRAKGYPHAGYVTEAADYAGCVAEAADHVYAALAADYGVNASNSAALAADYAVDRLLEREKQREDLHEIVRRLWR